MLDERDFGMAGLIARESLGPFVELQESGPIITIHDSVVEAGLGIGHHPHRYNERLFYILEGSLEHDDALNGITGHMGTGDLARLTEGRMGMYHKEWNNGDVDCRAFILVYSTEPMPLRASFDALRDADAPRYEEAPGVSTKELIGPRSTLELNGDIRFWGDSRFQPGAELSFDVRPDEGAMLFAYEGRFMVGDVALERGDSLFLPPEDGPTTVAATDEARLFRVVHGAGKGFVFGQPWERRRS